MCFFMESNGGNKCARKLDLAEILKTNISMEMFVPVKIIEEANVQKDILVIFAKLLRPTHSTP